ncbi:hypothetical protein [Geoanaerobacter pelophilus]|nr:hypothetical protein [Geoanaerobacter pelophilus]
MYHTAFSYVYWYFSIINGADAQAYYRVAESYSGKFFSLYGTGTPFISFLSYPFVHWMGVSYFSLYMLFNFFGFIGLCYFYFSVLEQMGPAKNDEAIHSLNLFLFIPGLNFWTSAIGKDSLNIFGMGMLLYAISDMRKRPFLFVFSLIVLYHVRPHVFLLVTVSLAIAFLLRRGVFRVENIFFLILTMVVAFVMKDVILEKAGAGAVDDLTGATEYLDKRQEYNLGGGSSLDISQYSFGMKLFSYLYRPLFFDAKSVTMLAASLENTLYLLLTAHLLFKLPLGSLLKERRLYVTFGITFFFIMLIVMSWATANLGIAVRQKMMFIPILLAVYCLTLSSHSAQRR